MSGSYVLLRRRVATCLSRLRPGIASNLDDRNGRCLVPQTEHYVLSQTSRSYTPDAYRFKRRDDTRTRKAPHPASSPPRAATKKKGLLRAKSKSLRLTAEQLRALQHECYRMVRRYHEALFQEQHPPEVEDLADASDVLAMLEKLHESCHNKQATVAMDTLLATEETFRRICKLLDRSISGIAMSRTKARSFQQEEDDEPASVVSEKVLDALLQARMDRADLIRAAADVKPGLMSFLRDIFVASPGDSNDDTKESEKLELIAHQDPAFGPSTFALHTVISSVYHEYEDGEAEVAGDEEEPADADEDAEESTSSGLLYSEQLQERVSRLAGLLDKIHQHNLEPQPASIGLVMKAHEQHSTLASALEAERLYNLFRDSIAAFSPLLYTFKAAAVSEKAPEDRAKAAQRAEQLVIQREDASKKSRKIGTHYKILLEIYANAGIKAIPDVCERADSLMRRLIGADAFSKLVNKKGGTVPQAGPALLHNLILIYASTEDEEKFKRAMNILGHMEYARDRAGRRSGPDRHKLASSYPNVETYNALLKSMKRRFRKREYYHDIFDRMTLHAASWPDRKTFQYLLLASHESPEEMLSKLEMRRLCVSDADRDIAMDASMYHWALGRLRHKAKEQGTVEAANRAFRLLERMEAQSGVTGMTMAALSHFSDLEQDVASSVYNENLRPTVEAYNLVLAACNYVTAESEKEEAFEIAMRVYRRMDERGLAPNKNTFKLLLWCCTNLQQKDSRKKHVEKIAKRAIDEKLLSKHNARPILDQHNLLYLLKADKAQKVAK